MKALIVVDVQNDFLPGGALEVPHGDEVIKVANRVMDRFDLVVATRDWHPPNHGSFASQHPGREPLETTELDGLPQTLWPDHCVRDTPGARLAEDLRKDRFATIISKGLDPEVDSYSGFFDNGRRHDTGLKDFLVERGVDEVYVLGLALNVCVRATALDAAKEGFKTYVIEDGTRAVELQPGDARRTLDELRDAGVRIIHSRDISAL